jgi:hypothetical protein
LNGIHISRPVECQLKMTLVRGDPLAKLQKMLKIENSSMKTVAEQSELADTVGASHAVCHEILTENLYIHCIAVKFVPRLLTTIKSNSA